MGIRSEEGNQVEIDQPGVLGANESINDRAGWTMSIMSQRDLSPSGWEKEEIPLTVRIAHMVLRICVVLALILGILLWTGHAADSLVLVHIGLGILVVLSLWTLGLAQALTKGRSWGLAIGAVVLGIILAASGGNQDEILTGSLHWVIQGIHLLLGLSAIGLGDWIGGRYRRSRVAAMS